MDPKLSDRHVLANSADPDQTAPRLHCLLFHLYLLRSYSQVVLDLVGNPEDKFSCIAAQLELRTYYA